MKVSMSKSAGVSSIDSPNDDPRDILEPLFLEAFTVELLLLELFLPKTESYLLSL
tara:strand:+ start:330 stop:494 length:165 start_codon:yes stop_codon:yes gene_type:complete